MPPAWGADETRGAPTPGLVYTQREWLLSQKGGELIVHYTFYNTAVRWKKMKVFKNNSMPCQHTQLMTVTLDCVGQEGF